MPHHPRLPDPYPPTPICTHQAGSHLLWALGRMEQQLATTPSSPPPLTPTRLPPTLICTRLEAICLDRWRRMEQQLAQCYRGIELRPPPDELRRWFRAARQQ